MQSVSWYLRRLSSMSPGEVVWRLGCKCQDATDRLFIRRRFRPHPLSRIVDVGPGESATVPDVLGAHLRRHDFGFTPDVARRWQASLVAIADRIASHHLDLFDLHDHHLGNDIDWNYEYKAKKSTPMRVASTIDYRDYASTGDCKFAWEPSRHHQLVVLGRAYRVTGDQRYAAALVEQLDSWICQCPFGMGMQWRSPLELAIRLINWVWALALIDDSAAMTPDWRARFYQVVHQHIRVITRKYSRFSSANNHLIGEAAGVFVACSYFAGLKHSAHTRAQSREILLREIVRQTYPDGGTREQATGYHLFVLQFFVLAGMVARNGGDDLTPAYWSRLEKIFEFAAALSESGDALPMIGDADDGYVIDLGGRDNEVATWLSVGATLFERSEFKALAGGFGEAALWLLGPEGRERYDRIDQAPVPTPICSRALPDSGYYLLQRGHRGASDRISVVFDAGELGFLSIAAHGHADALSVILRIAGRDVLIDPGTYDYFTYPPWREYFRSTGAHNTVVIDDTGQSQMLGTFLWGRRAQCRKVEWQPTARGGTVSAEHDGYTGFSDPVIHRRTVTLADDADELTIRDEIRARGRHEVAICWHLAEHCQVEVRGPGTFEVDYGCGVLTMVTDAALCVSVLRGSEVPIGGWVSRGYHRKVPATTLVGRCTSDGVLSLTTRLLIRTQDQASGLTVKSIIAGREDQLLTKTSNPAGGHGSSQPLGSARTELIEPVVGDLFGSDAAAKSRGVQPARSSAQAEACRSRAASGDLVGEIVQDLRSLAIDGLTRMYLPERHRFAYTLRWNGGTVRLSGTSRRYTAIVLIGLAAQEQHVSAKVVRGKTATSVCGHLLDALSEMHNMGDVALTLWAAGALRHPDAHRALERLHELKPAEALHPTVELAWALTALTVHHDFVTDPSLTDQVAGRLLASFNARSELFPHWPDGAGASSWRRHVTCFADWVYPVQALSHYYRATGDQQAINMAKGSAARMCGLQGEAGQWWWHFDVRTGAVIERYPVYAVHQDSMAPMALFALQDVSGVDHTEAVRRGLIWLIQSPELRRSLIDRNAGLIWRKVARREPRKLTRAVQALASRLHPPLRVPRMGLLFAPRAVDYECRPYHLGWVLYAFSDARVRSWSAAGGGA